jgi:hypothetical protein
MEALANYFDWMWKSLSPHDPKRGLALLQERARADSPPVPDWNDDFVQNLLTMEILDR